MANSKLVQIGGQIRFLSQYFLNHKEEELIHGAEIYAGFLAGDIKFVEEIETKQLSRSLFTWKFTEFALTHAFPEDAETLLQDCFKMLCFDAVVGNNDRHFYNWGVIRRLNSYETNVRFSPIYDSARGLFWNVTEQNLLQKRRESAKQHQAYFAKYSKNSRPKIGWEEKANLNHFELIELILFHKPNYRHIFSTLIHDKLFEQIQKLVEEEFSEITTETRRYFILECLKLRIKTLKTIQ